MAEGWHLYNKYSQVSEAFKLYLGRAFCFQVRDFCVGRRLNLRMITYKFFHLLEPRLNGQDRFLIEKFFETIKSVMTRINSTLTAGVLI